MKLEVPENIAPQIQALIANYQPPQPDRQKEMATDREAMDTSVARLARMWKTAGPMQRAREVRFILDSWPVLSRADLAKRIGVSGPAVGYHYRFTLLSPEDQDALADGRMGIIDAIEKLQGKAEAPAPEPAPPAPAAAMLDRTEDLVDPVTTRTDIPAPEPKILLPFVNKTPAVAPVADFDASYQAFRDWMGISMEFTPRPCSPLTPSDESKTIIINDTHIPFLDKDGFKFMVDSEAEGTSRLIIAGDIADMLHFSSFPKFSVPYTPAEGFFQTMEFLTYCNETFPEVIIFSGNHDARFLKWLVKDRSVPPEVLEYLELLAPGLTTPLSIMTRDLTNVRVIEPLEHEHAKFAFLYQFGDFVVTHAETYSKIPQRAAHNVTHWLKSFAEPLGLVKNFRCVGQAHTHQAGFHLGDYGVWNFELGCLCVLEEYVGDPKIRTPRPWVRGFTKVIQRNGKTDINQTRFVHTGNL